MEVVLRVVSGLAVGFSLGVTGGGGSLLAVPLLVYVVGQTPHMALGTSLASVGATSLTGAARRMMEGRVAIRMGLLFALLGGVGTYAGTRANASVPGSVLLVMLSALILILAVRMWRKGACPKDKTAEAAESAPVAPAALVAAALATGFASGFFGIGGGFLIVPALALVAGLSMETAVATSLLVIAINGAVGVGSYAIQGRPIDYAIAAYFVAGGIAGMWLGQKVGGRLDDSKLCRVFAAALMGVAGILIYKNL